MSCDSTTDTAGRARALVRTSCGPPSLRSGGWLLDLSGEALLERVARLVVELAPRLAGVPPRLASFPARAVLVMHVEADVHQPLQCGNHLEHRGLRAAGDVVDLARDANLPGGECRRDHVRNEGEVARLPPVAEHGQRLARGPRPDEAVERHVRALARSVHAEVAQRHGGESV